MKKINLIARVGLFVLILSLGTVAALVAGETRGLALADLSGSSVQTIAAVAHGDVIYAGLSGGPQPAGIYRSDDKARSWQLVSAGPGAPVNALVGHPTQDSVLYAGTDGGPATSTDSLWHSYDGGRTWNKPLLGLPASPDGLIPSVKALAVDPRRPGLLYIGTDGQGVYRFNVERDNYGYELIGGVALYRARVNDLVVGPGGRLYALTSEGLFVAEGDAWQKLSLPELAVSLAVAPDDPRRLYAGGVSTGLYRSTDGGQTWERVSNDLEMVPGVALRVTALAVDENNPRRVVAATALGVGSRFARGGIYESRDAGYSWVKLADADGVVTQLTLNRGILYAATAHGLARYGVPVERLPVFALPSLRSLANPSGIQVLILVLTTALAGLALVGRVEWVLNKKAQAA